MPTAAAVRTNAESYSTSGFNWGVGMCLKFARTAAGAPGGVVDAATAWDNTTFRHTGTPPAGAPVWWLGNTHGHVAISDGDGYCWSTDVVRSGRVDRVSISSITSNWGLSYQGWTEDINGVRITELSATGLPGGVLPYRPSSVTEYSEPGVADSAFIVGGPNALSDHSDSTYVQFWEPYEETSLNNEARIYFDAVSDPATVMTFRIRVADVFASSGSIFFELYHEGDFSTFASFNFEPDDIIAGGWFTDSQSIDLGDLGLPIVVHVQGPGGLGRGPDFGTLKLVEVELVTELTTGTAPAPAEAPVISIDYSAGVYTAIWTEPVHTEPITHYAYVITGLDTEGSYAVSPTTTTLSQGVTWENNTVYPSSATRAGPPESFTISVWAVDAYQDGAAGTATYVVTAYPLLSLDSERGRTTFSGS